MDLLVLAKEPRPGRVKTRLCPPCNPPGAAAVAEAALADTLDHALASGADRVVLVLAGRPGAWCPGGVEVHRQDRGPLAKRLAGAWRHVDGPAVLIGMDTPQVGPAELADAMTVLADGAFDAAFGPSTDGGWWLLGLRHPDPARRLFAGIPTSRHDTGARQLTRMAELGLSTRVLRPQRDVDRWADAVAVAAAVPGSRFAAAVAAVGPGYASGDAE